MILKILKIKGDIMTDLEMKTYKETYKFLYTDEDGVDMYLYSTYKLSLEQIHKCETDYKTKACIIDDGHMCKELIGIDLYYDILHEGVFTIIKSRKSSLSFKGVVCDDPWGKPHLYCI